jgi:hypothetical protein
MKQAVIPERITKMKLFSELHIVAPAITGSTLIRGSTILSLSVCEDISENPAMPP